MWWVLEVIIIYRVTKAVDKAVVELFTKLYNIKTGECLVKLGLSNGKESTQGEANVVC